jgi:hypothetical protein
MNYSVQNLLNDQASLQSSYQAGSFAGISTAIQQMTTDVNNYSNGEATFNLGNDVMQGYYPFATEGELDRCAIATSNVTDLQSVLSSIGTLPSVSGIEAGILSFQSSRANQAGIRAVSVGLNVQLLTLQAQVDAFANSYEAATGDNVTGIFNQLTQLSNRSTSAATASTASTAQADATQFSTGYSQAQGSLSTLSQLMPELVLALNASNTAKVSISSATQLLGAGDSQVNSFNTQYSNLTSALQVEQADFEAGRPVTVSQLNSTTAGLDALAAAASSAQPTQDQVDPTIIIGAIVVLLLLVGAVVLLRRLKDEKDKAAPEPKKDKPA